MESIGSRSNDTSLDMAYQFAFGGWYYNLSFESLLPTKKQPILICLIDVRFILDKKDFDYFLSRSLFLGTRFRILRLKIVQKHEYN